MTRKERLERRQATRFAWILGGVLAGLGSVSFYRGHPFRAASLLAVAAAAVGLATWAFPVWLSVFRGWMAMGRVLSWVGTRVLLTLFFYGILTPVGIIRRLLGKDSLDLAWRDGRPTYWIEKREGVSSLDRYGKQF